MAGWLWLTCRHRPSEPRLVCDLSLQHRLANGADSGRIGSACRLAQAAAGGAADAPADAPESPAAADAPADAPESPAAADAPESPAAADVPIESAAHWQGDSCRSCPILGESPRNRSMRTCYDRAKLRQLRWAELIGLDSTEAAQERQYRSRLALRGERVPADQQD